MSGRTGHQKHLVCVNAANLRESHFYLTGHTDFFPADTYGPPSLKQGMGKPLRLDVVGLEEPVYTDIPTDARTGRPRKFFRKRGWVSEFFEKHNIKPGDIITIERIGSHRFRVSPQKSPGISPTVIDLFCGVGGMTLGFVRAGFKVVAAYDHWDCAVESYRQNFGDHVRCAKICETIHLPPAMVIIGGPPCQGFSSAGTRRVDDQRNTLVSVFARLITQYKPQAFVFENVEGFLTGACGRFIFELLDPLIETGYRIHLRKINAANYGVPQHRKRTLAIGGLGWSPSFPLPTHSAQGAPGAQLAGTRLPLSPSLFDALAGLPSASSDCSFDEDHSYRQLTGIDLERARRLKPGHRMRDLPEELWHESYRRRAYRRVMDGIPSERRGGAPAGLRRLCADEPSKAITGAAINEFIHPTEERALTIRECARIQTFPDDFRFLGSRRDRAQLIGNAVPPRLAEIVARSLLDDLRSRPKAGQRGALLSFVPTLSTGMSPVLDKVKRQVEKAYYSKSDEILWA